MEGWGSLPDIDDLRRRHREGIARLWHAFYALRDVAEARDRGPRALLDGLVILGVLVHVPHVVERLARENVLRAEHRRHHGVILVVVLVHAVAPDQVQPRVA